MLRGLTFAVFLALGPIALAAPKTPAPSKGPAQSITPANAKLFNAVVGRREVVTELNPIPETRKGTARYLGTTRFMISAKPEEVRKRLTDYSRLKGMSEYIHTATYLPKKKILVVKGKVIGYEFGAALKVDQKNPNWIRYTPQTEPQVDDHTDIFLEPVNAATAVHFESEITLTTRWIPDAVVRKAYRLVVESLAARFRESLEKK